jgi:DNA repair photolyase
MAAIYEPSGAAREYSPLAMNYIKGCDHGCVYCVHPDTLILLASGKSQKIKNIEIGESIVGLSKEQIENNWGESYTDTQVLNKIKTIKPAYKITMYNGTEIICSADHRWLVSGGIWKYTNSLASNNYIRQLYLFKGSARNNYIPVKKVEPLNETIEMYDITTGTENFIANGLVSHNCYVPKLMKRFDSGYVHSNVYIKEEKSLLKEIEASCKKHYRSNKQVFLSFLTDPYSSFNDQTLLTKKVLQMLLDYQIPTSILSKGGLRVLQDLDLIKKFGDNIQVGASLTFTSHEDSLKWEKGAALPAERFEALKILHEAGVKTWASMEPVIYPDQSLEIMEITKDYVDAYKIGKLNHFPKHEIRFDWQQFLVDAVGIMRKYQKPFYIKKDLLAFKPDWLELSAQETDMDYLALKNNFASTTLL